MSGTYAKGTTVSPEKSRNEIEQILRRYDADAFGYATDGARAKVEFRAHGRFVRFVIPLPTGADVPFSSRSTTASRVEQETRRRWRALALAVKAKLEVVDSGIATFEEEFAVHMVLPDGSSVGSWLLPKVAEAYESGRMPESLYELPPAPETRQLPAGESS